MQIKSDRIVFPDNTEQFTASGVTLESLGIPNHDKVTVGDTGILGGISKVNLVKDGNDSAVYTAKTNLGHFGFGVGVGTAKNCFNVYDYTASAERMSIDAGGNVITGSGNQLDACLHTSHIPVGQNGHVYSTTVTSDQGMIIFRNPNGVVGRIYTTGSTTKLDNISARASDVYLSDDYTGKNLKETLADRDKIIDKLMAKVDALETKLKKVK